MSNDQNKLREAIGKALWKGCDSDEMDAPRVATVDRLLDAITPFLPHPSAKAGTAEAAATNPPDAQAVREATAKAMFVSQYGPRWKQLSDSGKDTWRIRAEEVLHCILPLLAPAAKETEGTDGELDSYKDEAKRLEKYEDWFLALRRAAGIADSFGKEYAFATLKERLALSAANCEGCVDYQFLRAQLLKERAAKIHDYWIWQGDGTDKLESLGCHVLIHADELRALHATPPDGQKEKAT